MNLFYFILLNYYF